MNARDKNMFLPFCNLEAVVADSIKYLKEHEPPEGYYVGFSGGKDSIVTKKLCDMAGVKYKAYYSCTRIDPPEVVQFIRKHHADVDWLFPKKTFWERVKTWGAPQRTKRWCCDDLKKQPGNKIKLRERVVGIRAEESSKRAERPRTCHLKKQRITHYKPIFHWSEYHVWEFIDMHGLPYPSLYDEGFHRLGCVICPYSIIGKSKGKKRQREISTERWPAMWKAFESSCREWFNNQPDDTVDRRKHKTFEAYYKAYLDGFE